MTQTSTDIKSAFTDNLPDSGDALEVVVRAERQELKRSLDALGNAVRDKVDLKSRLREQPLVAVGAAMATGVALGVLSKVASGSTEAPGEPHARSLAKPTRTRRGTPSQSPVGEAIGRMASTIAGLVGQRLAVVAEDIMRSALPEPPVRAPSPNGRDRRVNNRF